MFQQFRQNCAGVRRMLNHKAKFSSRIYNRAHQAGASLLEMMIGLALSLVVTTSMVVLMGNSMGTATRIVQMSQLTDELRNTMSMVTRDIRRANYNANALYCFANSDCGEVGDASAIQAGDIAISTTGADTCVRFGLDRDWDGNSNNDGGGAFRKVTDPVTGIGRVEMWVSNDTAPVCGSTDTDLWIPITDPDLVNITQFEVENSVDTGSYSEELAEEDGETLVQRIRFVRFRVGGQLNLDTGISRAIEDTIKIRNDFYEHI